MAGKWGFGWQIWLIPALPCLIGVTLLGFAWNGFWETQSRLASELTAVGKIVRYSTEYDADEGTELYYPHAEFETAAGEKITLVASVGGARSHAIGEAVEVLYEPDAPHAATLKAFGELYFATPIPGLLGTAFFAVSNPPARLVARQG